MIVLVFACSRRHAHDTLINVKVEAAPVEHHLFFYRSSLLEIKLFDGSGFF